MTFTITNRQAAGRPRPKMATSNYLTYCIRQPMITHFRPATCAEVDCGAWRGGWQLRVEQLTPELLRAARNSGKRYREMTVTEGETYLVYEPGQACFDSVNHRLPLERPAFFYEGRGDFRSFTIRRARQHANAEDWADSMAHHLDHVRSEIQKG